MAGSTTRRNVALNEEGDRISRLPQNLQDSIFSLLPIRDAIRTSILSKKWRYRWTTIPSLVFDSEFIMWVSRDQDQSQDSVIRSYEFATKINKLLLMHNGPLVKFYIEFPPDCDARMLSNYICQWIPLLTRYGVQELTIENWVSVERDSRPTRCSFDPHTFSSLNLTYLRLYGVEFHHNTVAFRRFTHLTTLELVSCKNFAQKEWVLDCPALEILTLEICVGISRANFRAPKLKCLRYYSAHGICLQGLNTLKEFLCYLWVAPDELTETNYNVVAVLGSLHKIKKLTIGMLTIQHLATGVVPLKLRQPLIHLQNLHISGVYFTDLSQVLCILCMLRSSPNLCKLEISARSIHARFRETVKNYRVADPIECTLNQLKIVTFNYFNGLKTELELMKFIFFHSPSLKKIFIRPSEFMRWNEVEEVIEEMEEYSFASEVAEIVLVTQ